MGAGTRGGRHRAFGVQALRLSRLPGDRVGLAAREEARADARRSAARRDPHRHRRAARQRGACLLPATWTGLHHRLPHALPRHTRQGAARSIALELCLVSTFPCTVVGRDGAHRRHAAHPARPWLRQSSPVVARRGSVAVQAGRRRGPGPASAGVSLRRSRVLREEPRRFPEARSAGHQTRLWRRPGPRSPEARIPRCRVARGGAPSATGECLQRRRCVRVPQPQRDLRPRHAGGDGLRIACGGLPGARAFGRCRVFQRRRVARRSAARGAGSLEDPPPTGARPRSEIRLEARLRAVHRLPDARAQMATVTKSTRNLHKLGA